LYLPRLRSRTVFEQEIQQEVASEDFFGTAVSEKGGRYKGVQLAVPHVQIEDSRPPVEPSAAVLYPDSLAPSPVVQGTALTQP